MFRSLFAFAAAAALVAAGGARSQPTFQSVRDPVPMPLAALVLAGIDDPVVVAELKLSDEQVKTLVARRQAGWDEQYTTVPTREATVARVAASDAALKKTLSAEQYRRATQIAAQRALSLGGPPEKGPTTKGPGGTRLGTIRLSPFLLANYPELADALKLTEEQRKPLTFQGAGGPGGFGVSVPLTPAQRQAATEFMGPPLGRPWVGKTDPRVAAIPRPPRALDLLAAKDVRADAGVTDEQAKAVSGLAERWVKLATDRATAISPKEAAAAGAVLAAETEKALAAALSPAQLTRLRQIERQADPRNGSHVEQFYARADAAREFGITPEQVTAIDAVWAAFRTDAAKVLLSPEPTDAAAKRLADLANARRAKAEAVLTADQAAKVKDAFGAPFTGSTRQDLTRGPGTSIETMRAAVFGRYSVELPRLASDAAVQAELKLTPEQVKSAAAAAAELRTKITPIPSFNLDAVEKVMADRSAYIESELGKILTPAQGKRFREIMMQAREETGTLPGSRASTIVPSAISYPGAAEAVGLTADQRKALLAGTAPAEVLTAPQKAALAKLMGEPFAAARPTPAPFTTTRPSRLAVELAQPGGAAERELALTPEQTKALAAARETYQAAVAAARPGFGTFTNPATLSKAADAGAEFEKALVAALDANQKKRLPEVTRQLAAAADLTAALTAADALDLTADQKTRLAAVAADAVRRQQLLLTHGADTLDRPLAYRLRDAADERLLAVLTDAQRAKWAELTGPPVQGLRKTIPSGFGFDGFPGSGFVP